MEQCCYFEDSKYSDNKWRIYSANLSVRQPNRHLEIIFFILMGTFPPETPGAPKFEENGTDIPSHMSNLGSALGHACVCLQP